MHPNIILLARFYAAYASEDVASVREIFAHDIIWHIPGLDPLSGAKLSAHTEVLTFFDRVGEGKAS